MTIRCIAFWLSLSFAASGADPGDLFAEAERLARGNQMKEAMAKVDEAVAEIDLAQVAGEEISWQARNGLRFAARLAREEFLDYEQSFRFCDKLLELADTDQWRASALLEKALTYREMKKFGKAQHEYDAIAVADQSQRSSAMMPQAEMVYFDVGDEARGRELIIEALMNEEIPGRERFNTIRRCAQQAMSEGQQSKAMEWFGMLEELTFRKTEERDRYLCQTWYEMGRIEESRARTARAKTHYRKAMELKNGEMRYRVRARDALESIQYFE